MAQRKKDAANAKYDAELAALEAKPQVEAPTIELDTQMSDFADYSTDEYDLSFEESEVDKNLEKLIEPTNNLGGSVADFLKESNKEQRESIRANINELKPKCK